MYRLKNLLTIMMILIIAISLSSCSSSTLEFHVDTLTHMRNRIAYQQELIRLLFDSNAINETSYNSMIAQTNSWSDVIITGMNASAEQDVTKALETVEANKQKFAQMRSSLSIVNQKSSLGKGYRDDESILDKEKKDSEKKGLGENAAVKPYPFGFNEQDMNSMKQSIRYRVKVLKKDINENVSIDSLASAIQACKKAGPNKNEDQNGPWFKLRGYFEDSGKVSSKLPILKESFAWDDKDHYLCDEDDENKEKYKVPKLSEAQIKSVNANLDISEVILPEKSDKGWKWAEGYDESYWSQENLRDLKIWTVGYAKVCVKDEEGNYTEEWKAFPEFAGTVRINQVNKAFVDMVTGKDSPEKIFINTAMNEFYLIEYPVYGIGSVEVDESKKFKTNFVETDLVINIGTGELRRRTILAQELGKKSEASESSSEIEESSKESDSTETHSSEIKPFEYSTWSSVKPVNQQNIALYKLSEQQVKDAMSKDSTSLSANNSTSKLSFRFNGTSEVTNLEDFPYENDQYNKKDYSGEKPKIYSARFILTDYLEMLDIPSVVNGEQFISLGRMFRVKLFQGDITDVFASYIDNAGNELPEVYSSFKVIDLLDKKSESEKYKLDRGVVSAEQGYEKTSKSEGTEGTESADKTEGTDSVDKTESDTTKDDDLSSLHRSVKYVKKIDVLIRFPSEYVGKEDYTNDSSGDKNRMVLYGMKVDLSPFATSLYGTWVKRQDESSDSLTWWNKWLSDNFFNYHIEMNRLESSFIGNFGFEMQQSGNIILDTKTIEKIQEEMNENSLMELAGNIRMLFIILGVILIFYSAILPFAWLIDVNMVFGPKFLTIMTAGKWIAISDVEDSLNGEEGGVSCVAFKDVMFRSLLILAIGISITFFDAILIINAIVQGFSSIVRTLYKMIFN